MRVGAVDIGSNALRAVVLEGDPERGRYAVVEDRREAVRLGAEVFGPEGRVSAPTLSQAGEAMRAFARDFRRLGVEVHRAVATSAVREARNRAAVAARLEAESGIAVDVITGAEEARLVAFAVRVRIPALRKGRHAILDVGGGSAELIVVEDGAVLRADSYEVGAVRTLKGIGGDGYGERFLRLAREFADAVRPPLRRLLAGPPPETFSCTGGNMESLVRIAGRRSDAGRGVHEVRVRDLERLVDEMGRLPPRERMERWGLKADRADVIVPAGIVYTRFAEVAGAGLLLAPHVGLRDAVALDLLLGSGRPGARERLEEERVASALALGRKFRFDEEHARRTARLSLRIFDRVASLARLKSVERDLLEMAAILHDIGIAVSPNRHHRHSAYLIRESELAGITPRQQEMVAQVARYHRRGMPREGHAEHEALPPEDRRTVAQLAGILRLADALDRDRALPLRDVEVRLRGGKVQLRLVGRGDRLLELWAAERKKDLFEREFRREVEVVKG
jgi:exopolyphosphatase/guanosine-5'-triphosphate,3'-diphosphate pyrophosphatase